MTTPTGPTTPDMIGNQNQFSGLPQPLGDTGTHPDHPEPPIFQPRSHGLQVGSAHPSYQEDVQAPLPGASWSQGAFRQQTAWRKPSGRVLPYSASTASSVFYPGAGATE